MWTWRAGGSLITEPDLIADEYRAIVAGYLEETRRICTDINADYRLVRTGDALEDVLTGFLMGRQKKKAADKRPAVSRNG